MDLRLLLLQSVYFMVPAYFANMAPVIAQKLKVGKWMNKPIDHDQKFQGKPLFGKNKTYRGLMVAVIAGIILASVQLLLYPIPFFKSISITDYQNWLFLGFLLGAGAIIGDLAKSFLKRRVNIRAGSPFIPFDQIDFILGAFLFTIPFFSAIITWPLFWSSLIASFFLHIVVNHISFYLGVRKEKW